MAISCLYSCSRILAYEFNHVACCFFVRQQKFEFIVTLNGCIYGAKCCRYCAFMFALIHYMNFCTAGLALKAKKKCLLPVGIFFLDAFKCWEKIPMLLLSSYLKN